MPDSRSSDLPDQNNLKTIMTTEEKVYNLTKELEDINYPHGKHGSLNLELPLAHSAD